MADEIKAQKLAAARKKVNKYKKLRDEKKAIQSQAPPRNGEDTAFSSGQPSRDQTPVDSSLTNSTHSSINNEPTSLQPELPNYFSSGGGNDSSVSSSQQPPPPAASFFDHLDSYEVTGNLGSYFNGPTADGDVANENSNGLPSAPFIPPHSSVESLMQLSKEMSQFTEPDLTLSPTVECELENRNQELAMLLQQERIKNEQLSRNLAHSEAKIVELESEMVEARGNIDARHAGDDLRNELQRHIQTVGILVAEKTELLANTNQLQLIVKQKSLDCEELQVKLKASRSRVADLERELNTLKSEKLQYNSVNKQSIDNYDKLRSDYQQLKDEKDELIQDLLETREKLKTSSETNLTFQQQLAELSGQLSMAGIKIQQLTSGGSIEVDGQIEKLTQEKFSLEKQIVDLNQIVKNLSKDRDESNLQYHQYAQELNTRLDNLANKVEELQQENESLQVLGQNRVKHIGELERQLQTLQNDHISFTTQKNVDKTKKDLDISVELATSLQNDKQLLEESCLRLTEENTSLLNELDAKNRSVSQLESLIDEMRKNQPDHVKLLATMESDKVAASMAIMQNTELKKQMDGMQEVFVKLSNDKVELTDQLSTEQHNNRELLDKLQKTELHLQTLAEAIEIKDNELSHLRNSSAELDRQVLHTEQLSDRLRHYEAQENGSSSLQVDLQEAKQTITNLTIENNRLKENNNPDCAIECLDKESAMEHLERKFLRTMEDIANLTEEKQRLEHLVLQLQGETETIGEYVALYQHQRSLLHQKTIEKDQQLTQLAEDRQLMKNKLEKLNGLVKKLVIEEKGSIPSELLQHQNQHHKLCEEHAQIHDELNKITDDNFEVNSISNNRENEQQSTETANEIIALLSEIKSSNLVQPSDNFHHCAWCSGKLITV